ncbi:hypothetical protein FOCG_04328 [Fusarium oxysporum f. sp. radicis-lycopersici 26381]|uniref:Flo11 n=2 Tax=Fusarium oxysporum TaxID=5507 RepID=A0A4Q2VT07_FUSOX|nr:hypothetical protein FOWG_07760 [Fusarium oxysporum f. sp. lycopersici MN25]EXL56890.1 hypothetical protein FOCG_04328 [Fusarium oxysporum f. sp. radicis-lycopersici 26381]KAJ4280402.1 hypothetical protein NW764_004758 [Fusarium oxysporum]RKK20609.1 hypothetical protein BFJ65_g7308 [Fusarium oxysporum f. sp. cepae]RYC89856.1 hypothetical protein BFJ63_vAg7334 [Fusarium oxysporum f. sp. narcissi]
MATSHGDLAMSRPTSGIISPRDVRSRTQSISSDRPSTIAHSLMSPPLAVSPSAAFIAASAASQIVTNDHDSHADTWYDQHGIEPASDPALVSGEALQLVNNFLDQLLFNFLSKSQATTLANLRPAVSEVLKPKLAKDAVNNADEELREYLGDGDEEDYVPPTGDKAREWDLELVWKRTRLRCMVYSSLGDMEEEDEDLYMEQENLELGANESVSDVISPAVAIFLTSVLEYMGELTLTVAGQAAYHRLRAKYQKEINEGTRNPADVADRIVVEEQDMERVALDRTLGRLWRGWKKRIRSPVIDLNGRPFSRASNGHLRQDSVFTDSPALSRVPTRDAELETQAEAVDPSQVALPIGSNDVDEIEIPGLAYNSDDEDEELEAEEEVGGRRPKSLLILPLGIIQGLPTPTLSQPNTPDFAGRKRSNSLPTPGASPYRAAAKRSKEKEAVPVETSVVGEEQEPVEEAKTERISSEEPREVKEIDGSKPKDELVPEPVAPKSKRLSKIITSRIQSRQEIADEDPTYEKAEILTSARVSVAGSSSPALSDTGGPFPLRRSSSVHSARIIDVAGPKSPSGSRSPSADAADRIRRASLTIPPSSGLSNGVSAVDVQAQNSPATSTRPGPKSRSPVDAMRGSMPGAATISESDEEMDRNRTREQRPHKYIAYQPSTPTVPEAASPTEAKRPQTIVGSPHHSPVLQRSSSSTKVASTRPASTSETAPEKPAEVLRKPSGYSNRHAARNDKVPTSPTHSIGMVSIERSRTRDSDEDGGNVHTPRPTHTSGSSASSGTSRLKAVRTSEDNGSRSAMARNFEELIQSNQTITYTLTPENMRNMEHKQSLDNSVFKGSMKNDDSRAHNRSRSSSAATDMKRASPHHRVGDDRMKPLPSPNPNRPRMSAAPRDARVPSESTADFAEFIKSTGPAGDSRPMQLRNGPPGANSNRIPHNIAPWDTAGAEEPAGGKAVDANIPDIRYSQASTHGTESSMPSIHSSINSNTALLKNKGQPAPTSKMFDEDDMMPKRKTRRVKDPYAIDFSDDEDDEVLLATPKPPAKKEESLAEFLMNYEPPPEPVTTPISQKIPKKKASAPSLIGRFTRKESNHSNTAPASPQGNDTRSLSSRAGFRNYIPIQVNVPSGYDKYGMPTGENSSRPSQPASSASSGRRVPMKKFEPRDAVSNVSRTSDLAAFLRTSEPPPEPVMAPPPPKEESSSSLSKMFSRRKK